MGAKPPSSPTAGVVAGALQRVLQRMEDFGAHAHGFGDARGADRHDHEFLEVDRIVGMHAAIDDVHHRHGQQRRARAADITIERRSPRASASALAAASDTPRMALAPSRFLFSVPSRSRRRWSSPRWSAASKPVSAFADLAVDRLDRLPHALAAVALAAVAELMRLVRAGRGAGRAPRRGRDGRPSSTTSTSTVGLPRLSRISRPTMVRWRSCAGPLPQSGALLAEALPKRKP